MPVASEWSISCCRVILFFFLVSLVGVAFESFVVMVVVVVAAAGADVEAVGADVDAAGGDGDAAGAGVAAAGAAGVVVAGAATTGGVAVSVPEAGAFWASARPAGQDTNKIAATAAAI